VPDAFAPGACSSARSREKSPALMGGYLAPLLPWTFRHEGRHSIVASGAGELKNAQVTFVGSSFPMIGGMTRWIADSHLQKKGAQKMQTVENAKSQTLSRTQHQCYAYRLESVLAWSSTARTDRSSSAPAAAQCSQHTHQLPLARSPNPPGRTDLLAALASVCGQL
jgi:hypothetical protein